jgi:hypothetical protein
MEGAGQRSGEWRWLARAVEGRQGNSKEGKMSFSRVVLLHITAGTFGMLSGSVATFLRKGSRQHGLAGNVFVI